MLGVEEEPFGTTDDGKKVARFRLRNGDLELDVITWGAVVQALRVPDRDGHLAGSPSCATVTLSPTTGSR